MENEDEIVKIIKCECCGIWEECTIDYIKLVKDQFEGVWVCGLCSEAIKDEQIRLGVGIQTALRVHTKFRESASVNDPTAQIARSFLHLLKKMISARKGVVSDQTLLP